MKPQHTGIAAILRIIPVPRNLRIDGLRAAAAETAARMREDERYEDLVCGFNLDHDLCGLMVDNADERGVFKSMLFEYGFSIEFNEADDDFECKIRVWVRDDYEWTGTDKQVHVSLS